MFKFLFVMFFFFVLLLFLMGFSVVRTFKRMLFGNPKSETYRRQANTSSSRQQSDRQENMAASKKKLISKDEGEYVEYEEVKD